jgi:hypothetical protein
MTTLETIGALVQIIQQHGQHDFPSAAEIENDVTTIVDLCGLTLHMGQNHTARLSAFNIDAVFEYRQLEAANDEASPLYRGVATGRVLFTRGSEMELHAWHRHLARLHTSFAQPRAVA